MVGRGVALWCAVLATCAGATAYTVDCNRDTTDCDQHLISVTTDKTETMTVASTSPATTELSTTTDNPELQPKTSLNPENIDFELIIEGSGGHSSDLRSKIISPNDELMLNLANKIQKHAVSGRQNRKMVPDLSDVNLDNDEDEPLILGQKHSSLREMAAIPHKIFTNMQSALHPTPLPVDSSGSAHVCMDKGKVYVYGQKLERECEETCECTMDGAFECTPTCKKPFIRRGSLPPNDPLCFETHVNDCCSIIACTNGNHDSSQNKTEESDFCRYNNTDHPEGSMWHEGCKQTCRCENGIVVCKPRCEPIKITSEKCINVPDPSDTCCEMQVCDVTHDAHEENTTVSTQVTHRHLEPVQEHMLQGTDEADKDVVQKPSRVPTRPLVLSEPIGSVKVLQNNSVQVTLIHMNSSEDPIHLLLSDDGGKSFKDIKLAYSNLILNLEGGKDYILKTKETDTKFNFTITNSDFVNKELVGEMKNETDKIGCYEDGKFYEVGSEFHIGCSELCECTGNNERECAALECPAHVGLELVARGCVRWAAAARAAPPHCCPRPMRCLSTGACTYNNMQIPNWSEVPISLTGCEKRCFCENGELECQEVCSPLPAVPPASLRCPPTHRIAPVNISDEDCCQEWGCVINPLKAIPKKPNKKEENTHFFPKHSDSNIHTGSPIITTSNISSIKDHLITNPVDLPKPPPYTDHRHPTNIKSLNIHDTLEINDSPHFAVTDFRKQNQLYKLPRYNMTIRNKPKLIKLHEYYFPQLQIHNHITDHDSKPEYTNKIDDSHPLDTLEWLKTNNEPQKVKVKNNIPYQRKTTKQTDRPSFKKKNSYQKTSYKQMLMPNKKHQSMFLPEPYYKNDASFKSTKRLPVYFFQPNKKHTNYVYDDQAFRPGDKRKVVQILRASDNINRKHHTLETYTMPQKINPYQNVLMAPNKYHLSIGKSINTLDHRKNQELDLFKMFDEFENIYGVAKGHLGHSPKLRFTNASTEGETTTTSAVVKPIQPFLPTLPPHTPPEIPPAIKYPHEELGDYDQNDVHKPILPHPLPNIPNIPGIGGLPPVHPGYGEANKKLAVISLQADSPTSVKMLFGLPPVLVGLRGSVDLRYTDKDDEDISHWYSQVFAPADEILTTSRLEFRLSGLKPSTLYKVRAKLYLHNLPVEPESEIYTVKTQDLPVVEEKRREIDSRLSVTNVNDTAALVTWRHFTEDELRFIDGIQIRYRPVGTPIYLMTELLHNRRTSAELRELRPETQYEASLVLPAPPQARTELYDINTRQFTTSPHVDPYGWSVRAEAITVGAQGVQVAWRGVPEPAERWVRVFRAAHACDSDRDREREREKDAFRLATRDQPAHITLTHLPPHSKCRVWLELFLTNGKVKTSNVLEINTKSLDEPEPIDNVIEASSVAGSRGASRGDYYGALVAVGVIAALGAITSLLLLLIVVRRHRPHTHNITPLPTAPRESSLPPYDNPAYKLELQQETMDL